MSRAEKMTFSVCYKCGASKAAPLDECGSCFYQPKSIEAFRKSLVLSSYILGNEEIEDIARSLHQGLGFSFPADLLIAADLLLHDPLIAGLLKTIKTDNVSADIQRNSGDVSPSSPKISIPDTTIHTSLHSNPFSILRISIRDSRKQIIEAADERSLELGEAVCLPARAQLTNPRQRIAAEVRWLPGVSPARAQQLIQSLETDAGSLRTAAGLPALTRLNLLVAGFELVGPSSTAAQIAELICEIAKAADLVEPDQVMQDINEDRTISAFAEVKSVDLIQEEIAEHRRHCRNVLKETLNRLATDLIVEAMTIAVDVSTRGGEIHAPELIDDLVDGYEVEAQGFLQAEARNVELLLEELQAMAGDGEHVLGPMVDKIEKVAKNWDKVAQPVQLSAKARGMQHEASHKLASNIRNVGIILWNEHDYLEISKRLTILNQEVFAELPVIFDRVGEDMAVLENIEEARGKGKANGVRNDPDWEREIQFSATVGLVFRDTLRISAAGVSWKGKNYTLDSITRIRWGVTVHKTNGIKTRTVYSFAFGDNRSEVTGSLGDEDVFENFIGRLWKAVGFRILTDLVDELKSGRSISFGYGKIEDEGAILVKHRFLGKNEAIFRPWSGIRLYSANGLMYLGAKDDKSAFISSSYLDGPNTHIFDRLISTALRKPRLVRVSEILD